MSEQTRINNNTTPTPGHPGWADRQEGTQLLNLQYINAPAGTGHAMVVIETHKKCLVPQPKVPIQCQ